MSYTTSHSRRNDCSDPPLRPGRACTSCRRRKIRCDGLRPTCTNCLRGNRATDWKYTIGNQLPQVRARTPEDRQATTLSVTLNNTYSQTPKPITSRRSSPVGTNFVINDNPVNPAWEDGVQSAGTAHLSVDNSPSDFQYLIDTLAPYASDLGIFLSLLRLRAQPESITPALRSALILSSFHLTRPSAPEQAVSIETLISRLLHTLVDVVVVANPRLGPQFYLQTLQAEVLLVYHLLLMGRVSIAQSHVNAAMSLAIRLGLHMRSGDAPAAGSFDFLANFLPRLPLPGDAVEEQERADAWWTIYSLVKFAKVISVGSPDVSSTVNITAPWPDAVKDGVCVPLISPICRRCAPNGANRDPVSQFLLAQYFRTERETPLGLQARASALLGEAHSIAAAYCRDSSISRSAGFCSRFTTLDNLIQNFFISLPHPATLPRSPGTGGAYTSQQILLVVNLAALARITLHCPFALLHVPSNRVCVETAIRAVQALNGMEAPKIMNPICVVSRDVVISDRRSDDRSHVDVLGSFLLHS
ncbi:hypothetical protein PISMIDRAFT_655539 [Pisolithus microcarpus 441]|uniref:Zn(2)-C6 fungal-type domain-containing protein n=1 Tax=Pisolithus microcarpus 441 TaxID=765257 RepID=A0A0C9Z4X0_9AGAM|nr:hypothetical protein BKA83DRAFT_655539 [Pisolithus microcarpus]KIK21234.1 hypothetical protein PISMIDRAFT_655539 [Pisolithus microcarpus 441]